MMIEKELQRWVGSGSFDLPGLVIRSSRFRLIPSSRPDGMAVWDDAEVAWRWLLNSQVR